MSRSKSGKTPAVIGVDVGGTKVLAGCVDRAGRVLAEHRSAMDRSTRETTLASIQLALDVFLAEWSGPAPLAVGIGLVGQTDPASGTWVGAMNLPIDSPVPLAAQVAQRCGLPAALDNDVHAATLAELRWGIGREADNFIYINVGTGIAAGFVFNGQLVRGAGNYAGELGHLFVEPGGPKCVCGRRGCLEPVASGAGILQGVRDQLRAWPDSSLSKADSALTTASVFQAADAGDPLAVSVSGRAVRALATALTGLVDILNPAWIVYGGGTLADGWLMDRVRAEIETRALPAARRSLQGIVPSQLDPARVGLLGAACLAWDLLPS
jgi:glucokinase